MENVMLCKTIKDISEAPSTYIKELKLDGIRSLFVNGRLINRHQQDITDDFKEIQINFGGVLDGEIVIFKDDKITTDFNALQNHKNNNSTATYVAFDILEYGKERLADKPLHIRRAYLTKVKSEADKNFITILDLPVPSWAEVVAKHLEGLIIKNPNAPYEFKRSKSWCKLKNWKEVELPINSFEETKGEKGNAGFVIKVGDKNQRVAVGGDTDRGTIKANFGNKKLSAVVQYLERTSAGMFRFPSFKEVKIYG